MTILVFHRKKITDEGDIIERKVWKIDKSKDFPEGIKYSLVYIHKNKKLLGYDNEKSKGHHKHYFGKEKPYAFIDDKKLISDFYEDVRRLRSILYGKKENKGNN